MGFSLSNVLSKNVKNIFNKNQLFYRQMPSSPLKSVFFWIFHLKYFVKILQKYFQKYSTFLSANGSECSKKCHFLGFDVSNILSKNIKNIFKEIQLFYQQMAPSPLKSDVFWFLTSQIFCRNFTKIFLKIFLLFISKWLQVL